MPVASHAKGLNGSASSSSAGFQDNYHDGGGPSRGSSRQSIVTSPTSTQNNSTPNRRTTLPSPLSQMTGAEGSDRDDVEAHPAPLHPPSAKKNVRISPGLDPDSPCYIHSGLDNHGSLSGWLRNKHDHLVGRNLHHKHAGDNEDREPVTFRKSASTSKQHKQKRRPGAPKPLTPAHPELVQPRIPSPPTDGGYESESSIMSRLDGSAVFDDAYAEYEDDDDETRASSLSRRLAETAQGVREVSKELSRTRVHSRIQSVLIVTKARDNRLITLTRELALYCMLRMPGPPPSVASSNADIRCSRNASPDRGMIVYVDDQLRHSKRFDAVGLQRDYPHLFEPITSRRRSSSTSASTTSISTMASSYSSSGGNGHGNGNGSGDKKSTEGQLRYWTPDMCSNSPQLFDFVVTLGGDGTVLFTSWLFQRIVPPVLPFALGSLGFLTNFDFKDYRKTIDRCVDEGIRVNLRMRFTCTVYRAVAPDASMVVGKGRKRKAIRRPGGEILVQQVDRDGWEALEGGAPIGDAPIGDVGPEDREIMCFTTRPVEQFEVLNDLVVDRGPSPFVSLLEVFGEDHHLTTVQADGLTVSTPTGSTAYSLSAGGSLVHPGIPAILLTPICPHTLSFRPMLLPDGMELRVCVPYNSRSTAWASFDGRGRIELKQGDHIKITASKYPFPTVCAERQSTDWFKSIQRTLKWNERERQKSFVVVEDDDYDHAHKNLCTQDEVEYFGSESDSEDEFDIDDRSGGELTPPQPNDAHDTMLPPLRVGSKLRHLKDLKDEYRSGVQSPDRFASSYEGPPPLSQRHLLEALAQVENKLKRVEIDTAEAQSDDIQGGEELLEAGGVSIQRETVDGPATQTEAEEVRDGIAPLPIPIPDVDIVPRTESETTLGPDYLSRVGRHLSDSDTNTLTGTRTPRQGRSRSRSRVREGSRSHSRSDSPHVGATSAGTTGGTRKQKAFAFFGQSELSEGE